MLLDLESMTGKLQSIIFSGRFICGNIQMQERSCLGRNIWRRLSNTHVGFWLFDMKTFVGPFTNEGDIAGPEARSYAIWDLADIDIGPSLCRSSTI